MDIRVNVTGEAEVTKLTRTLDAYAQKNEAITQKLGKQYLEYQKLEAAYAAQTTKLNTLTNSYSNLKAQVVGLDAEIIKLQGDIKTLSAAKTTNKAKTDQLTGSTNKLNAAMKALAGTQRDVHSATRGTAGAFGALWLSYGNVLPMISAFAAASTVKNIVQLGSSFEYLTKYASELSGGVENLSFIREQLLSMKDLAQTPGDLAGGLLELTKAGLSAKESIEDLPTVAKFAAIAEQNLAVSTKQLVTITNAFGDATKKATGQSLTMADTADIVAMAAQGSVASFGEMQTALKYTTALASSAGMSLQEVAAGLMVMHDKGIAGSMGATAIRTALTKLIDPSNKALAVLEKAGIKMHKFASDDVVQNMGSMLRELNRIRDALSVEEWKAFEFAAFGFRGELTEALITNMDKYTENLNKLAGSAGFVDRVFTELSKTTKVMADNLVADFQRALVQAFEGEKAREILTDLRDIVSSPGFSDSLEDIADGAYHIGKALAGLIGDYYKLPVTVQEIGIIAAIFFGWQGKLAMVTLAKMGPMISDLRAVMNTAGNDQNFLDLLMQRGDGLAVAAQNIKDYGIEYVNTTAKIKVEMAKLAEMEQAQQAYADRGMSAPGGEKAITQQRALVDSLVDTVYAMEEAKKAKDKMYANSGDSVPTKPKAWPERPEVTAFYEPGSQQDTQNKVAAQLRSLHKLQLQSNADYQRELLTQNKLYAKDNMVSLDEETDVIKAAYAVRRADLDNWLSDTLASNQELIASDAGVKAQFESVYEQKLATLRTAELTEITKAEEAYLANSLKLSAARVKAEEAAQKKLKKMQAAVNVFDTAMLKMKFDTLPISKYEAAIAQVELTLKGHLDTLSKVHGENSIVYQQKKAEAEEVKQYLIENDSDILRSQESVMAGMKAGWLDLQKDAVTVGEAVSDAFTGAFSDAAEGLADFLVTGEMDFKEFTAAILSDMAKIIAAQQAAGWLNSGASLLANVAGMAMTSMYGGSGAVAAASSTNLAAGTATPAILNASVYHGGGGVGAPSVRRSVPAEMFTGAPRLHNGLAADEYPAILQRGEEVTPASEVKASKGVALNVTNNINISSGAGGSDSDKEALTNKIIKGIRQNVVEIIAKEKRYGGVLYSGRA